MHYCWQDRKHSDFICGVKDHLPSHEGFGNSVPHAFEQQFFTWRIIDKNITTEAISYVSDHIMRAIIFSSVFVAAALVWMLHDLVVFYHPTIGSVCLLETKIIDTLRSHDVVTSTDLRQHLSILIGFLSGATSDVLCYIAFKYWYIVH